MNHLLNKIRKNKFKRFFIYIFLLLVIFSVFESGAYAIDNSDPYDSEGNLSLNKCIKKGNLDFLLFLNTLIYNDGFYEGVIEPWKDVLARNKCHATDVSGLIKQQDKIRKYIRDAFLTCNTQKLPPLEKAFDKLNIEIYYVRHVIDGNIVLSLPYDILSTRMIGDPQSLYVPKDELYSKMKEKYVGKTTLTLDEFDLLFGKLDFKYQDRKNTYIICENDTWGAVAEKFEEFVNTAGGITPAWNEAKKAVGRRAEKIVESVTDGGLEAWYAGRFNMNLNNLPFMEGLSEIGENIDKYLPNLEGPPTQGALIDATSVADKAYKLDKIREEMSSDFYSLYKETADAGVQLLVEGLKNYNTIIINSYKPLDTLLEGTEKMNSRQCPGKF